LWIDGRILFNGESRSVKTRILALFSLAVFSLTPADQFPRKVTKADVDRWMTELSNWGRWGKDDQLGAVNLITAEKRRAAAALVQSGASVSLARRAEKVKAVDNDNPFRHTVLDRPHSSPYWSDSYEVAYHGYGHTHLDALCHIVYQGKMFNGVPASAVTAKGAGRLSVFGLRNGILSRGVLMDIPELKGVPYLQPGTAIYPEDLEAWEKKAGIRVQPGDIVLIRTGRWTLRDQQGPWDVGKKTAGLHVSCARWLKQRDVAILGSDAASDVIPSLVDGVEQPVHQLAIVAMGVPILDNCDFEELSRAAKKANRWQFMLTAAPLAVEGGTGSPLNPIATF
jgi:kynurenine formamidase